MKPNQSKSQLELALHYAAAGIPVFPTNPRTKRPLNKHGHLEATTDPAQIRAWWSCWPNALVALPTGQSTSLWVLDVDGKTGWGSFKKLLVHLGLGSPAHLANAIVETPSDGLHFYFKLRSGVIFHNGAPLTSREAVWSIKRYMQAETRCTSTRPTSTRPQSHGAPTISRA